MKLLIRSFTFAIIFILLSMQDIMAQCAMCRTVVENNVSAGEKGLAASLNFGILYMLAAPYLFVGLIGFLWYKKSRKNAKLKSDRRA